MTRRMIRRAVLAAPCLCTLLVAGADTGIQGDATDWLDRVAKATDDVEPVFQSPARVLQPYLDLEISVDKDTYHSTAPGARPPVLAARIKNTHHGSVYLFFGKPPRVSVYLRLVSVSFDSAREQRVPNASEMVVDVGALLADRADPNGAVRIRPGEALSISFPIPELFGPMYGNSDLFCIRAELRSTRWAGNKHLPMEDTDVRWLGRTATSNPVVVRLIEPC